MKLLTKFFILLIFSFHVFSCKMILGLKDPTILTPEKLNTFFLKNEVDTTHTLTFIKEKLDSISKLPYKPEWQPGFKPIQYKAFDTKGNLISQYASCEGSLKKIGLLNTFPPSNKFEFDSSIVFTNEITLYKNYYGEKPNYSSQNYDISFIVYWGTWLGAPGKSLIKNIQKYKDRYPDKKIQIIYVNVAELYY